MTFIKPLGTQVLLEITGTIKGLELPDTVNKSSLANTKLIVKEIGVDCKEVRVGNHVLMRPNFAGIQFNIEGMDCSDLVLVREADVVAVIHEGGRA